jgi:GTP-binding protein EngB required for normal cell division
MAEIPGAPASGEWPYGPSPEIDWFFSAKHEGDITTLREKYKCHFRILVIGRANAGKTTILEKVCGVAKGTKPIIIHDEEGELQSPGPTYLLWVIISFLSLVGEEVVPGETHLIPSIEVSQWYTINVLIDSIRISEGHPWYQAWDYIWRK